MRIPGPQRDAQRERDPVVLARVVGNRLIGSLGFVQDANGRVHPPRIVVSQSSHDGCIKDNPTLAFQLQQTCQDGKRNSKKHGDKSREQDKNLGWLPDHAVWRDQAAEPQPEKLASRVVDTGREP